MSSTSTPSTFEVFFDGECPLCQREITMLRGLDRESRILFTDIAAPGFDPAPLGLTREQVMNRIHGRGADGVIVEGVEVFRRLYDAVGFGPLVEISRAAPIAWLLDRGYEWFAANRLRLTGRCTDETCAVDPSAAALKH